MSYPCVPPAPFTGQNLSPCYGPAYRAAAGAYAGERWLQNTDLLQHDQPKIRLAALRVTQLKAGPREKALACHEFVRRMPFGCASDAATLRAVDVLHAGMGDCFTKSTLFIALLRSIDIPARARVVALRPGYLRGVQDTAGRLMEHLFTEVLLGGRWLGVDTYVVDPALELAAKTRLFNEGRACGYGVHSQGQVGWDGEASAFGQFSTSDPASLPVLDLGAFDDVGHFMSSNASSSYNGALRRQWAIASALVNRRIRKIRETQLALAEPARASVLQG